MSSRAIMIMKGKIFDENICFYLNETEEVLIRVFLSNPRKQGLNSQVPSVRGEIFIAKPVSRAQRKLRSSYCLFPPESFRDL